MSRDVLFGTICLTVCLAVAGRTLGPAAAAEPKLHIVVVTGGHGFDEKGFAVLWNSFPDFEIRRAEHKKTAEAFSRDILAPCDVLVLYDMAQNSTEAERKALEDYVARGGAVVALHHCIASHPSWPQYEKIIGGKYLLKDETREGREILKSSYKHDVKLSIRVADPAHPVTRGLSDFELLDEAYKGLLVDPKVHVLLTTDSPENSPQIAWARQEGKARIVYIQLGHDNHAFADANYRRLVKQAILWTAGRE